MKFFYDSEFIEGFLPNRVLGLRLPKWLSKRRHAIDLISIAIVAEDGEVYSAISNEYHYEDASDWVKQNVIDPLYVSVVHGDSRNLVDSDKFHKYYGKSNKQIAEDIKAFVYRKLHLVSPAHVSNWDEVKHLHPIHLYGYYSAYDHVLLSSLFGRMMDLPEGFPMYTIDLKQMLDDRAEVLFFLKTGIQLNSPDDKPFTLEKKLEYIKGCDSYPKLTGEHLAVNDAKWTKQFFEFLEKY